MIWLALLELLLVLLPLLAGVWLIVLGARGGPVLSEPHCAKCGYDLRGHLGQQAESRICPECGADLSARVAVDFGRSVRRKGLIIGGVVVLLLPLLLVGGVLLGVRAVSRTTMATRVPGSKSNAVLIADLKKSADQPWTWQELENRYARSALSDAEVASAVDELIASIDKKRQAGQTAGNLPWSTGFLKRVQASIAAPQQSKLCESFYGPAAVPSMRERAHAGRPLMFSVQWGGPWNLPGVKFAKALREVRLEDGKKLAARWVYSRGDEMDPDQLSAGGAQSIDGKITGELAPGEHTITFVVDAGALPEESVFVSESNRPGQKGRWVKPIHTWSCEVSQKVTVVAAGETVVETVRDAALDPVRGGMLKPPRLVVRKLGKNATIDVMWSEATATPVDVVAKVSVRIAGQEHSAGEFVRMANMGSTTLRCNLPAIAADVIHADVLVRPNIDAAERFPQVRRIWGADIVFEGVVLERYDLPSTGPVSGSSSVP